jgi:hypothetical protein
LPVDPRAANGVPGKVSSYPRALLNHRKRVANVLGCRSGFLCLPDPSKQNGQGVGNVVQHAREIAVWVGRIAHGTARYDKSLQTSPPPARRQPVLPFLTGVRQVHKP